MAAVWGDTSHGMDREPQPPATHGDAIDRCSKSLMIGVCCRRAPVSSSTDHLAAHAVVRRHAAVRHAHTRRVAARESRSQDGASRREAPRARTAGRCDRDRRSHRLRPDHRRLPSSLDLQRAGNRDDRRRDRHRRRLQQPGLGRRIRARQQGHRRLTISPTTPPIPWRPHRSTARPSPA